MILVTGGTGKTGRRIVEQLNAKGVEVRVGSRQNGFDWLDPATFEPSSQGVKAAYLIAPPRAENALEAMQPFLEHALTAGVEHFVLQSASVLPEGTPMMGEVHAYLRRWAPSWTVLRPTWFMQNFSEQQHQISIQEEGAIYSATQDGRIPFIDLEDLAAVAVETLTHRAHNGRDFILTGPESISYDDVAQIIAKAAGRPVEHRRLSVRELTERFVASGMPARFAAMLAGMDGSIAQGTEDHIYPDLEQLLKRPAGKFADYARKAQAAWRT